MSYIEQYISLSLQAMIARVCYYDRILFLYSYNKIKVVHTRAHTHTHKEKQWKEGYASVTEIWTSAK